MSYYLHISVSLCLLICLFLFGCSRESNNDFEKPVDNISDKLAKKVNSGRYIFEDGSLYEGELVMGIPDGFGTIEYVSGDLFEGQFSKGLPNGYGTIRYKSDDALEKYSGNWENGKRSGFGTLFMNDRSELEGHWVNGVLSMGKFRTADGIVTFGKWMKGEVEEGNLLFPTGDRFSGKFQPDGSYDFGTLILENGVVYYGEFENGVYHGSGILSDGYGMVYTGSFFEGGKSGIGVMEDTDGSFYNGEFLNGLPHGKGRQSDPSGVTYTGSWENGEKHGSGRLDFGDGTTYTGTFENGRAINGIYDWGDGSTSRSFQDENGNWQDFPE